MALAPAISKQPTKKLDSLKMMRLTIGFLAIGSQLIRTANAVERRWSGLWPPVFRVSGPGPRFWRASLCSSFPIVFLACRRLIRQWRETGSRNPGRGRPDDHRARVNESGWAADRQVHRPSTDAVQCRTPA